MDRFVEALVGSAPPLSQPESCVGRGCIGRGRLGPPGWPPGAAQVHHQVLANTPRLGRRQPGANTEAGRRDEEVGERATTAAVLASTPGPRRGRRLQRRTLEDVGAPIAEQVGLLRGTTLGGDADLHPFEGKGHHRAPRSAVKRQSSSWVRRRQLVGGRVKQRNAGSDFRRPYRPTSPTAVAPASSLRP